MIMKSTIDGTMKRIFLKSEGIEVLTLSEWINFKQRVDEKIMKSHRF